MVGITGDEKVTVDPIPFLLGGKTLKACLEGDSVSPEFIPELVRMQQAGRFPVERLCKTYPYQELHQALEDMHSGKVRCCLVAYFMDEADLVVSGY
jgi:Zn-dependent alcohol dehydrogenase